MEVLSVQVVLDGVLVVEAVVVEVIVSLPKGS